MERASRTISAERRVGMREILFKAKKKDNGKWVEGSLHIEYGETDKNGSRSLSYRILGLRGECYYVRPDTVCQFTGLTDKNGNKIWENDIVDYYNKHLDKHHYGIVKYGDFNCSCCYGVYGWYFENEDIREHDCYEVIGNIFDNAELVEKE